MALTINLAQQIINEMNNTKDECLRFVYECALAQICYERHINYENNSYVGYRLTDGVLYNIPKRLQIA